MSGNKEPYLRGLSFFFFFFLTQNYPDGSLLTLFSKHLINSSLALQLSSAVKFVLPLRSCFLAQVIRRT